MGRSSGGLTTQACPAAKAAIVAMADALGNLSHFTPLPGRRHGSAGVKPLIEGADPCLRCGTGFDALLADKAFDAGWLRIGVDQRGAAAIIPPKANRKRTIDCGFAMSAWRYLVENLFCNLKEFRRIATRYDKTDCSFKSIIYLAGSVIAIQ